MRNFDDNFTSMHLGFGISFPDLYEREGLIRVDRAFLDFLGEADAALLQKLLSARDNPAALAPKAESDLLVALAPHFEDFIPKLFGIEAEARALAEKHNELAPIYSVKRLFVQRRALHKVKPEDAQNFDFADFERKFFDSRLTELEFARRVTAWQENEAVHAGELELAARYA